MGTNYRVLKLQLVPMVLSARVSSPPLEEGWRWGGPVIRSDIREFSSGLLFSSHGWVFIFPNDLVLIFYFP